MENDDELKSGFEYEDLKTEYNLTDKQIAELDHKSQHILGNAIVMIDGALRDDECTPEEKINKSLMFINITMNLIEKNLNEIISQNTPKEVLN